MKLALLWLLFALVAGLAGASAKLSKSPLLRGVATLYITVVRGVPDLVMMLLVFYVGQMLVNEVTEYLDLGYFDLNPMVAGVLTIGFIFGAYFAETFRGAFLAVPSGQLEAGSAYGMTRWQVFARVLFPQMLRHALPGLGNNWLALLKSTAIVSMIGLSDMTWLADQAGAPPASPSSSTCWCAASLQSRIARHRRAQKTKHWHIDYLREEADFITALPVLTSADLECGMAAELQSISDWTIRGFGSSDCPCETHLYGMSEHPLAARPFIEVLLRFRIGRLSQCLAHDTKGGFS